MTTPPNPLLSVCELRTDHLGPLSLTIAPGECLAVEGPSGAGKTLLLRALADLDTSDGEVALDGKNRMATKPAAWRREVGYLPAEPMWWADSVGEHLAPEADAFLPPLGFDTAVRTWAIERLSSGERQRLGLARLLANRPRVLLLDEPTANLDPDNTGRVESLIRGYRNETGAGVLWVSHDPAQRARIADRVIRIVRGVIEESM